MAANTIKMLSRAVEELAKKRMGARSGLRSLREVMMLQIIKVAMLFRSTSRKWKWRRRTSDMKKESRISTLPARRCMRLRAETDEEARSTVGKRESEIESQKWSTHGLHESLQQEEMVARSTERDIKHNAKAKTDRLQERSHRWPTPTT